MSHESQQAISHVLQQDSKVLDFLLVKLKHLQELQNILAVFLDKKLAAHCQVANLENNCLTIVTDNALWATQFRFQIADLLGELRKNPELCALREIRCKVRPKNHQSAPAKATTVQRLSKATSQNVLETAKHIKHGSLKVIMEKIAQNT
jgi:hypothetical protein